MNIHSTWYEELPDTVQSYIGTTAMGKFIPRTVNNWRCNYAIADAGDMEVIGFSAAGPKDGCINLVAQGVDSTVLVALVAATFSSVPRSNLLVECFNDETCAILTFLDIDNRKITTDGKCNGTERSDDERLHDDAGQMRSVPLARDEEGEDD